MTKTPRWDGPAITHHSTDLIRPHERLDNWQEQFNACHVSPGHGLAHTAFEGRFSRYLRPDASGFTRIAGRPMVCRFGSRESGLMLLGAVRRGNLRVACGRGEVETFGPDDGLVLLDCDSDLTTTSTDFELFHLQLPRRSVLDGLEPAGRRRLAPVQRLKRDGLVPILSGLLDALVENLGNLTIEDAHIASGLAGTLASALIADALEEAEHDTHPLNDFVFQAARRFILVNAPRHDLTATMVARSIGCSRARLYRIFAERGLTVARMVRDARLDAARTALETEPHRPVGMVAFENGYSDLSAFGKAFRRRFGMAPSQVRGLEPRRTDQDDETR